MTLSGGGLPMYMCKLKKLVAAGIVATLAYVGGFAAKANADTLETAGEILQFVSPGLALHWSHQENGSAGLKSCGKAVLYNFAATKVLKYAVDAKRPNGGGKGFPSGHTSNAAVGAGCMFGQEGLTPRTLSLIGATVITGYSRIDSRHHSADQVLAGAALGFVMGYLNTRHLKKNTELFGGVNRKGHYVLGVKFRF